MGRPVNKRKIGFGRGRIAVSKHFFTGGSEKVGLGPDAAHIYKQKGDSKFWIRLDADNVNPEAGETLKLVRKAGTGGGEPLEAGEFTIDATGSDSGTYQVTKLRNKTVQIVDTTDINPANWTTENVLYNVGYDASSQETATNPNAVTSVALPAQ